MSENREVLGQPINRRIGSHEEVGENQVVFIAGWRGLEDVKIKRPAIYLRHSPSTKVKIGAVIILLSVVVLYPFYGLLWLPVLLAFFLATAVGFMGLKILKRTRAATVSASKELPVYAEFTYLGRRYAEDNGILILDRNTLIFDGEQTTFSIEVEAQDTHFDLKRRSLTLLVPRTAFAIEFHTVYNDHEVQQGFTSWIYRLWDGAKPSVQTFFIPPLFKTSIGPYRRNRQIMTSLLLSALMSLPVFLWTTDLGLLNGPRAIRLDETTEQSCVNSVDATPRGLLAAGFVGDLPALWQSSDGDEWIRVDSPGKPALYGTIRGLSHDEVVDVGAGDGSSTAPADVLLPPSGAVIWVDASNR